MNSSVYTNMNSHSQDTLTITSTTDTHGIVNARETVKIMSDTLILTGPDADVNLGGVSLKDTLLGIQQRLGLLQPNPELEAEWHQLRALGDQYRALEQQLIEKHLMWDQLKQ